MSGTTLIMLEESERAREMLNQTCDNLLCFQVYHFVSFADPIEIQCEARSVSRELDTAPADDAASKDIDDEGYVDEAAPGRLCLAKSRSSVELRGASAIKCWWLPRNPFVC